MPNQTQTNPTNPVNQTTQVNQTSSVNQTNPVQTQNPNQMQNNTFDPSTLSPEAMAWVDRQRTQASQTARKNLMKDESFLANIRNGMIDDVQKEANQTVEQRMTALEDSLKAANVRASKSEVKSILAPLGLPEKSMNLYVDLFSTDDMQASIDQAKGFADAFNQSLQTKITQQTQTAMNNMTTPSQSATSMSEATRLQQQYDELRKTPDNPSKGAQMSSLIREAASKGVTLL